jgi:hypothetical protein
MSTGFTGMDDGNLSETRNYSVLYGHESEDFKTFERNKIHGKL